MIATGKRNIKSGSAYEKYFSGRTKRTDLIIANGDTFETLRQMEDIISKTLDDTAKIAPVLLGATLAQTCRNIWEFVYNHIQYKLDSPEAEQLRRPLRSWEDRKSGVDCDCYSILISSILSNLKIPHALRKTRYEGDWQHVYVVVPKNGRPGTKDYYTIDCVVDKFNYEVPFSEKHDKVMKIQYLNGVGNTTLRPGFATEFVGFGSVKRLPFGAEFIGMGKTPGLGATPAAIAQDFLNRTKIHLQNTLEMLPAVPMPGKAKYKKQLEYVLARWDDPVAREAALEKVSSESKGLSGLGNIFDKIGDAVSDGWDAVKEGVKNATNWVGDKAGDATSWIGDKVSDIGEGVKNAANWVGDKAKDAAKWAGEVLEDLAKGIIKYSPLTVLVRNGLLLALKINLFRMSERLGYGYWTEAEAREKGLDIGEWRKIVGKLDNVKKIHKGLQGDMDSLKKNIMQGWNHGTKKHGLLRGLGAVAETSTAAAMSVIIPIVKSLAAVAMPLLLAKAKKPNGEQPDMNYPTTVPDNYNWPSDPNFDPDAGASEAPFPLPLLLLMAGGGFMLLKSQS